MRLANKVAVVHGAGGVGTAVARAFAAEGARVHVVTRAEADALDEAQVEAYLDQVLRDAGRLDISFNAIGVRNTMLQGKLLTEISVADFMRPIEDHARANLITARAAAKRMIPRGAGVLLAITSIPSRIAIPRLGGVAPAMAAVEALVRDLSAELGPHGVRVVGLRPQGMPETATIQEVFGLHAAALGIPVAAFGAASAERTHLGRLSTLDELADAAVFAASDAGRGLTGTILNLSLGMIAD